MNLKIIGGLLGGLASIATILTFIGMQPGSSDDPPTPTESRTINVRETSATKTGSGVIIGPPGTTTLNVYQEASLSSKVVGTVRIGQKVTILCTVYGSAATGPNGHVSNLWNRISSGFVPDVAVDTGTNDPVASPC